MNSKLLSTLLATSLLTLPLLAHAEKPDPSQGLKQLQAALNDHGTISFAKPASYGEYDYTSHKTSMWISNDGCTVTLRHQLKTVTHQADNTVSNLSSWNVRVPLDMLDGQGTTITSDDHGNLMLVVRTRGGTETITKSGGITASKTEIVLDASASEEAPKLREELAQAVQTCRFGSAPAALTAHIDEAQTNKTAPASSTDLGAAMAAAVITGHRPAK